MLKHEGEGVVYIFCNTAPQRCMGI